MKTQSNRIQWFTLGAVLAGLLAPVAQSADRIPEAPKAKAVNVTEAEAVVSVDDGTTKRVISTRRDPGHDGAVWTHSYDSSLIDNTPKGPVTYLGIAAEAVSDDLAAHLPLDPGVGLIVRTVGSDSPAASAGVQPNDVLLKIDDQLLIQPKQMQVLVRNRKEGDILTLTYLRKGETKTGKATLVKRDPAAVRALIAESPAMDRLNDLIHSASSRAFGNNGGGAPLFQRETIIVGPDGKVTRLDSNIDVDRIRRDVEKELQEAGMAEDIRKQVSEALKKAEVSIKKAEAAAKKAAADATKAAEDARKKK